MTAIAVRSNAAAVRSLLRTAPRLPLGPRCAECGKARYATRQAAERDLAALQVIAWRDKARPFAYTRHGWWHLTSGGKDDAATAAEAEG